MLVMTKRAQGTSQDVEIVRAALEGFNDGGVEAVIAYLDPEVEWLAPPEWLEEPVYYGHDGVRKVASIWRESFDEYRLDLEEVIDAGDHVVALVTRRGCIKRSGDPIEQRIGYDWTVRGGVGVRVQAHFSWEDALAAAGNDG